MVKMLEIFDFNIYILVFLFVAAFIAGFIDSIAGGGGMITIPSLLLTGISPIEALATNKLQSSFGSFSAAKYFYKKGFINIKESLPNVIIVFVLSGIGTISVQFIDTSLLSKFLPFLIMAFGIYFLLAPQVGDEDRAYHKKLFILSLCAIGFYDGFFGPGTGSFFLLALIMFAGLNITKSLAQAKLYNFATNLSSVLFFSFSGNMLFGIGLIMACGQFIGANLGAKMALKYGVRIIKPLIVCVSFALSFKLIYDNFF